MPRQLLLAKFVESVKPSDRRQEFSDTLSPNLTLIVQKTGTKTWIWRGRLDGVFKTLTLGTFPAFDLAAARKWADEKTAARSKGTDLAAAKEKEEDDAAWWASFTCQRLFELYAANDKNAKATWKAEKLRIWNHDIKPAIGSKLVAEIEKPILMKVIRDKNEKAPTSAIHIKNLLSRMFKWAVTEGDDLTRMTVNPAANLVKLAKVTKRDRVLSQYEIGIFFRALDLLDSPFVEPTKVILYLGLRRDEAFEARWEEFIFGKDEDGADICDWAIPKERTKNEQPLRISLPHELVAIFSERKKRTGNHTFVWPSERGDRPMSGFSKWMRALREKMEFVAANDGKEIPNFTLHDLRRTLSTGMNGLREGKKRVIGKDIVERCLNHKIPGVEGVYDQFDYYVDKERAWRLWADYLQSIIDLSKPKALPGPVLMLAPPESASA